MKKMTSLLLSLLVLPVTAALPPDGCGVPNYDIQRYGNITITGYIKTGQTQSGRDTLSLMDKSGQVAVVDDIIAEIGSTQALHEEILKICPEGSRCTLTGVMETRERQTYKKFIKIKQIVKEESLSMLPPVTAALPSESEAVPDAVPDEDTKLYKDVTITGYVQHRIEHYGTPSDYYILSFTDSTGCITLVDDIYDEFKSGKEIYDEIRKECPEGSRCTLTGDMEIHDYNWDKKFINIKKIVKD